jgi:hypothetical protein
MTTATSPKIDEAAAKQMEDELRAKEFSDDRVQAFRAVVQTARSLDEMVDRKLITPKEAMERLHKVASTPVELKKPNVEPEVKKTKFEEEIDKALEVPDPDAKTKKETKEEK